MSRFAPGPPLAPRRAVAGDPAVSVVVPTFRRPDALRRALASVLAQTSADLEVIVVDDEPSDEARAVVDELQDPRVRYVPHDRNRGLPAARNTGVRHSRGRYLAFLDDDDEWLPTKLEQQVRELEAAGPGVGVATCFQEIVDGRTGAVRQRAIPTDGDVLGQLLRDDAIYAQVLLIEREVLERVGLFVEEQVWLEDYELTLRLAEATRWVTSRAAGVRMHRSAESMSTSGLERRVAGWSLLLERHGAAAGRRARGRWWTKVARLHDQLGDRPAWRAAVLESLRANPVSGRTWALAAAGTIRGPGAHARLARARGRRRERATTDT